MLQGAINRQQLVRIALGEREDVYVINLPCCIHYKRQRWERKVNGRRLYIKIYLIHTCTHTNTHTYGYTDEECSELVKSVRETRAIHIQAKFKHGGRVTEYHTFPNSLSSRSRKMLIHAITSHTHTHTQFHSCPPLSLPRSHYHTY